MLLGMNRMLNRLLVTILRSIKNNKIISSITILGLAIGLTATFLMFDLISFNLSYDNFIPDDRRLYRVISEFKDDFGAINYSGKWSLNIYEAEYLFSDYSNNIDYTYYAKIADVPTLYNQEVNYDFVSVISPNFFEVIPIDIDYLGDDRENGIIIDSILADRFFHDNQINYEEIELLLPSKIKFRIIGIVDIPENSHLFNHNGQFFIDYSIFKNYTDTDIYSQNTDFRISVYLELNDNSVEEVIKNINRKIAELPERNSNKITYLDLERFDSIHLKSSENVENALNPKYLIVFLSIFTLLIILLSITNSVSIKLALSYSNTKNIGIKKILGSNGKKLTKQIIAESIIYSLFSLVIAVLLSELLRPTISNFLHYNIKSSYSINQIIFMFLITIVIGFASGLLPALKISSLSIIDSLSQKCSLYFGNVSKIILTIQLVFCTILVLCSCIIMKEFNQLRQMNYGFNHKNIIIIDPGLNFESEDSKNITLLKNELTEYEGIESVAYASWAPMYGGQDFRHIYIDNENIKHEEYYSYISKEYINTLNLEIIEGSIENNSIVIMESILLYRDISLGDYISINNEQYKVCCIVKDYIVDPPIWGKSDKFHIISNENLNYQIIRFNQELDIKEIYHTWNEYFPNRFPNIKYLDRIIIENNSDPTLLRIVNSIYITMILALIISGLALFGISIHGVKSKRKEIAIKKINGASSLNILASFFKDFLLYFIIAILIGIPISIFAIISGLKIMGYGLPIDNIFLMSLLTILSLFTFGILIITISTFKEILEKPSVALRYE